MQILKICVSLSTIFSLQTSKTRQYQNQKLQFNWLFHFHSFLWCLSIHFIHFLEQDFVCDSLGKINFRTTKVQILLISSDNSWNMLCPGTVCLYTDSSDGEIRIGQRLEKSIPGISDETNCFESVPELGQFSGCSSGLSIVFIPNKVNNILIWEMKIAICRSWMAGLLWNWGREWYRVTPWEHLGMVTAQQGAYKYLGVINTSPSNAWKRIKLSS